MWGPRRTHAYFKDARGRLLGPSEPASGLDLNYRRLALAVIARAVADYKEADDIIDRCTAWEFLLGTDFLRRPIPSSFEDWCITAGVTPTRVRAALPHIERRPRPPKGALARKETA